MKPTRQSPLTPAQIDWQDGTPVATHFDDPYFSRENGLAESQYVFLHGNQLASRFAELESGQHFVIGETGFGTGLNACLAADCFLQHAPGDAILHLVSVEKHPLTRSDMQKACAQWPSLTMYTDALLKQYPPPLPGYHRLWLAPRVALTLMYGDALTCWASWQGPSVDAWFLDGFAPARNPDMWCDELFLAMANSSHTTTTLATFTAAGFVRRGLQAAGFNVLKTAGFGRKRHRLVGQGHATTTRSVTSSSRAKQALVAGAGLAGATTARALAERGWQVTVVDPQGIAQGASGNLAGVVYSSPSPHMTAQNRFYQRSYSHALGWFSRHGFPRSDSDGALNNVVQHYVNPRQQLKYTEAMDSGAWPEELLQRRNDSSAELLGGGYIRPGHWCAHLLQHPNISLQPATLVAIDTQQPGSALLQQDNQHHWHRADVIVLCNAAHARQLDGLENLPLKVIRGQVSYVAATADSQRWQQAHCHGGYFAPALDGLHCVGATFDLHHPERGVTDDDNAANLAQLGEHMPEALQDLGGDHAKVIDQRVAQRCQSIDFLPLCGPLSHIRDNKVETVPGVYLNLAHGSRGITGTPLCAELLADQLSGSPRAVEKDIENALDPGRFLRRALSKQGPRQR